MTDTAELRKALDRDASFIRNHHEGREMTLEDGSPGNSLTEQVARNQELYNQKVRDNPNYAGGPFEYCGWCEGTGYMTPKGRGEWLRFKKQAKRAASCD